MRIVYFAHSVLDRGGDKMVLAHLGHLASSGHAVTIRTNRLATNFSVHPGITLERPLFPGKLGTLLSALLEKQQGEVVLASIVPTAVLLAVRNRGRVLHFAQDDNESGYSLSLLRALMRALYRLAFGVFRLPCIAVSQELAESFKERYAAACIVVENGVDTQLFHPLPDAELAAPKEAPKALLCLARSDRRKGYDLALRVAALLEKDGQDFELWTVGEDLPRRSGGVHRYFGMVDQEALREIMRKAQVFLYPSRSEGFGLMVLEACACGCPVATTEAIGFVQDGVHALVSPVDDAESLARQVALLFRDEGLRARLIENGLRLAQTRRLQDSSALFERELCAIFRRATEQG